MNMTRVVQKRGQLKGRFASGIETYPVAAAQVEAGIQFTGVYVKNFDSRVFVRHY